MHESQTVNSIPGADLSDRKPVREWCLYGGVLAVVMCIAAGRQMFVAVSSDKTGLCAFILLIFLAALFKSLRDVIYIQRQIKLADSQVQTLWQTNNVLRFLKATQQSLFRQHIHHLYHIYRRDTKIDQDNLVTLLQARLRGRTRIVDLCSSILITLGLVGTIVGLIASVSGLEVTMSNVGGDAEQLLGGMKTTLSGMGIAFYTTLLGAILGGVCLRILGNVVETNLDFLVAHIAELAEVHILPVLRSAARMREANPDAENLESAESTEPARPEAVVHEAR